ncbi:MAG: c-type cytochrome domain-containing protein, partial [Planctomycetota bacterium]
MRYLLLALTLGLAFAGASSAKERKPSKEEQRQLDLEAANLAAKKKNLDAYESDVKPFLAAHCIGCHGPKKVKGDLSLDLLDPDMLESTSASRWAVVREKLEQNQMPPKGKERPERSSVDSV